MHRPDDEDWLADAVHLRRGRENGIEKNTSRVAKINTHHGLNVRVRNCAKLLKLEFKIGSDVDVCALVLRRIAVPGRREN